MDFWENHRGVLCFYSKEGEQEITGNLGSRTAGEPEDKSNNGTAILDMYAVETATGKVIAANKQSWSDVGCEAYRTATGE